MGTAVNFDLRRGPSLREFVSIRQAWFVGLLFAALMAAQALGFLLLGTGRWGRGLSESILVVEALVAFACACVASRRAHGITALFWLLFSAVLLVWAVPTALQAFSTLFEQSVVSDSTWRLLYCLYGAPILMMLFLPNDWHTRVKSEIFLDLFQIAIVVSLVYSTFFFLPSRQMMPNDALLHDIGITDKQTWLLLVAALVRLQFARVPSSRSPLLRLTLFLLVSAIAFSIGDWIDLRHDVLAATWFDLGWAILLVAAGFVAITWTPSPEPQSAPQPANFLSFLGTNLVLVAMLSCINLLMDRWKQAHGETLTNVAIAASLFAFTLRLALTQFHQQQEIAQRKAAQKQVTDSHQKVRRLLDNARRQTAEITQISELGSLLQACASREEVFRLIPERLRRLFPGASGCISVLSGSRNRVESVAEWGVCPADQIFSPEQCGLFAADARMPIPVDAPNRVALTCSGKVLRFAFLLSRAATPSERCPSRMMIPRPPFLTQTMTPTPLLAAVSSPLPSPNTSLSRLPTLTSVNLSACRPSATRSPAYTTAAICRSSSSANSTPLAATSFPRRHDARS
jgi:hypothetical protein